MTESVSFLRASKFNQNDATKRKTKRKNGKQKRKRR